MLAYNIMTQHQHKQLITQAYKRGLRMGLLIAFITLITCLLIK